MPFNLLIQQQYDEACEALDEIDDPIERASFWFEFIRIFSKDAQIFSDKQYNELEELCNQYSATPDPHLRNSLKKEIKALAREITHFSEVIRKVNKVQKTLQSELLDGDEEET